MKSKMIKLTAAVGLAGASALAFASQACCGDLAACCLEMLACCF